jgi:hypothetical protein
MYMIIHLLGLELDLPPPSPPPLRIINRLKSTYFTLFQSIQREEAISPDFDDFTFHKGTEGFPI